MYIMVQCMPLRVSALSKGRRDRDGDRREWCQVDNTADHLWSAEAENRLKIEFLDKNIAGMSAHHIVKAGISQVPEGRRIFAEMTVMENLDLGAFIRKDKAGIAQDLKMVSSGAFPAAGRTEKISRQERFPAVSSRCWRWAVRS